MSGSPLHRALIKPDCSLDDIKVLLEEDASSVNALNIFGERPLHLVLKNKALSAESVKLLMDYGADVNLVNKDNCSPLYCALFNERKGKVIELLLENEADVNRVHLFGKTSLHVALQALKVEKLVPPVLKLLLQKVSNVNKCDSLGRTPLCFALRYHGDSETVQLLLDAGARMNVCKYHVSPLHCYVSKFYWSLKVDVMIQFLDVGVNINKVDKEGNTPLHLALRYANCGLSAIAFLLDHKSVDINARNKKGQSPLHCALENRNYKVSIIELLIQRGAKVEAVCNNGNNSLFFAVQNHNILPGIIRSLLNKGCPVNVVNKSGHSLLQLVAANLYEWKLNVCKRKKSLDILQLLIKYFLLTNPKCYIEDFIPRLVVHREVLDFTAGWLLEFRGIISGFIKECLLELQAMENENIASGITLRQFLEVQMNSAEFKENSNDYDRQQLWKILENNKFRVYFEVILAKIGRTFMIGKLQKKLISTEIISSEYPCIKKNVILDYPSVRCVVNFLPDNALFNIIRAFRNYDDCIDCCHLEYNNVVDKRSLEQSSKTVKRSRINI